MSDAPTNEFGSDEGALLSPMEEGFWRGPVRVVVLLRLDGRIEERFLTRALARVQQRHPKLRATLVRGSDGRARYRIASPAPAIRFQITDHDGETPWREESRRLLELPNPPEGPVAAVRVLRSRASGRSELILSVHHGIADGRSGLTLVAHLLTEYADAESGVPTPARPARPLVTTTRPTRLAGWWDRLWLARRLLRMQRIESRSPQTALPEGRDVAPLGQWVHWVFSRDETLALVRRCRTEKVSPSGALVAAVYSALLECLPVSEALFKWQCPFEVRDSLEAHAQPITTDDLGSFIGLMRNLTTVRQPLEFWDFAREVHQDLSSFAQHGGPAMSYRYSGFAVRQGAAQIEQLLLPIACKRPTLFFTNYGVVSVDDAYGSLRPRECTLVFRNEESSRPRLIAEALVMGQRLNIGFSADGLESAFWERLQFAVRRGLLAAAAVGSRTAGGPLVCSQPVA